MSNLKVGDKIILRDGTMATVIFVPDSEAANKVKDRLGKTLENLNVQSNETSGDILGERYDEVSE